MNQVVLRSFSLLAACTLFLITKDASRADEPVIQGMPLALWAKLANDSDSEVRRKSIKSLSATVGSELSRYHDYDGYATLTVAIFTQALRDPDAEVRAMSTEALAMFGRGPRIELEVTESIDRLKDADPDVRYKAARDLMDLRPAAIIAAAALTRTLDDPVIEVRNQAAVTLGLLRVKSKEAVPVLIEMLKAGESICDRINRVDAAIAIGLIGPTAKEAAPALTETMTKDEVYLVRSEAALALGRVGQTNRETMNALRKALNDESRQVRASAAVAVWQLKHDAKITLPVLIESLESNATDRFGKLDFRAKRFAVQSIGEMGKEGRRAIPILIQMLKDKEFGIGRFASVALRHLISEEK
jgi:HEAT repeat protein